MCENEDETLDNNLVLVEKKERKQYKIAIIGSREIDNPEKILEKIVNYLRDNEIDVEMVRSGNAVGTDQLANAFIKAPDVRIVHYLPWESYNKELQIKSPRIHYLWKLTTIFDQQIVELFPHMSKQTGGVWSLVRRNFQIIRGVNGDQPVDLVFWHKAGGELSGGTKYGVMLARALGIKDISIV